MRQKIQKCILCNRAKGKYAICGELNCNVSGPALCDMCCMKYTMIDLIEQHRSYFHTSVELVE